VPWAVVFKNQNSLAPLGVPLHPTQLYHSIAFFLIATILIFSKHYYFRKRFLTISVPYGRVLGLYFGFHGIQRFFIEFFRGDPRPFLLGGLSLTQVISIVLIIAGCIIIVKKGKR
jgi:phosphatidylglycerol:prolipoprotein diacylglycerol transferase